MTEDQVTISRDHYDALIRDHQRLTALDAKPANDGSSPSAPANSPTTHGCRRAGGFVDSSCTASCDCHVTERLTPLTEGAGS